MKVYILRHGETSYNSNNITQDSKHDIALTHQALTDIHAKAETLLKSLPTNTLLLCSYARRAKETADALVMHDSERKLLGCIFAHELAEVDFGDFGGKKEGISIEGCTMQDFRQKTVNAYGTGSRKWQYPSGDSFIKIANDCTKLKALINKASSSGYNAIVLIGHNRKFRHLLVELGIWKAQDMFKSKLPHGELVELTLPVA